MAKSDETAPKGETPSTKDTAGETLPYDPNRIYTYEEAEKIGRVGVPLGILERQPLSPEDRLRLAELVATEKLSRLSIEADGTKIGGDGCACSKPRHRRDQHKN